MGWQAIKGLTGNLAKQMHVSRSTFSTFYLPYLLYCIKNKSLEMDLNETDDEIVQKELEIDEMSWRAIPMKFPGTCLICKRKLKSMKLLCGQKDWV